jgi:hypothetical protein
MSSSTLRRGVKADEQGSFGRPTARPSIRQPSSPRCEPLESRQLLAGHGGPLPDMVLQWNGIMTDTVRADFTQLGPTRASRNMAVVDVSIYDAVNGIDHSYEPYLVHQDAPKWYSKDAAVAGAAYEALSHIYPDQEPALQARLDKSLKQVKDGPAEAGGLSYGKFVADQVLAARAHDGSDAMVQYMPQSGPGKWRPDPLNPGQVAWGPGQGDVTPFAIDRGDQFAPPPPPALTSKQYTDAFNEVKSLGAKDSTTRTPDQTQMGLFWAYDRAGMGSPLVMYDQALCVVASRAHNSLVQNARLFALAGIAMGDAGIAAWNVKFADNFWRPVAAIREADTDGNPATVADPNWTPLGAPGDGVVPDFTPPFPSYVSGHAAFGAAAFRILADFFGTDHFHFTLKSDELPGVTRSYHSFSQAAAENGRSRVYLGIHWNFDNLQGRKLGGSIADYVFQHELRRRTHK